MHHGVGGVHIPKVLQIWVVEKRLPSSAHRCGGLQCPLHHAAMPDADSFAELLAPHAQIATMRPAARLRALSVHACLLACVLALCTQRKPQTTAAHRLACGVWMKAALSFSTQLPLASWR